MCRNVAGGRNDRAIVDTLEARAHALQNQHGVGDEFYGLDRFHQNNFPTFMGRYDPYGAQVWLNEIEKIFLSCGLF